MKSNFRIWNNFIWRTIPHVLVIVAPTIAFGAMQVDRPSAVETKTTPPGHERAEILNGGLQRGETSAKECVDVVGPRSRGGVERAKLCQNSGAELYAGSDAPSMALTPERKPVSGERSKDSASEGNQCDGYCGLYLTLPLWIVAYYYGLRGVKPNV